LIIEAGLNKYKINIKKGKKMTYSSSLAMNRSRFIARNQNAVSFKAQAKSLGPVSNTLTLIVLACLLGMFYLSQVTRTNAFGYQINNLQQTQANLKNQESNLQVESARLQSINRIDNSSVAKSMVAVSPSGAAQN
jgi:uncharacterized membrane protein